ncbi:hypothetical protein A3I50_00180 [Candidatus Roizmanbacteria bacterium RIFCSPLOWO2_02_FULL_37_9]|nr:MAG: hypothetical protein A3I50_00180 [Candidatus Roizmanbacteria bacterium RIFCSPLOWO2_02_FULL_37_9]
MKKYDLSIIITSYNTREITRNCLDSILKSLKKSSLNYEIIVVDNASPDDSAKMLESLRINDLRIIENKKNLGFGKANNQAVELASSDYILFLNSDILVLDSAIKELYKFYKQNENMINFLGGKLLNKDMTLQPSCGPFYTLPVVFAALFLRGDYYSLTRYSPNKLKEVDWISGACILTKKQYLQLINGFDDNIFMYMDEIDLLYRAKMKNYRVFFYPNARFIHLGSASSGERKYPILQVFKGLIYFYKKHYSAPKLILLKIMLKLKARVGLTLGNLFNNAYLKETYGKALKLVEVA